MLHHNDALDTSTGWLKPFLFYLAISLRLFFFHVPITIVTKPIHFVWRNTGPKVASLIPEKLRVPAGALIVIGVMLVGAFASPESRDNTRANRAVSLFGLAVIILVMWATSKHRSMIKWHTVIVGMLVQFLVALFVLRSGAGCEFEMIVIARSRLIAIKSTSLPLSQKSQEIYWVLQIKEQVF